ncbi:tetratricopeptide repeat protein [Myxococcus sp. RHST-1-4]|nr:tetratricopeptide repeat protein [Myxococcus sp. RHSTA-1-4]
MESISLRGTSARALLLGVALMLPGLALAQNSASIATAVEGQEAGFRARLQTAARLYEELEYEQSLEALFHAKAQARSDEDRVQVALYRGIVLADLGQRPQSLTAFREALSLNLDARLPVRVSPKVERDFENVREELRSTRAAEARAQSRPRTLPSPHEPSNTDRPVQSSEQPPGLVTPPMPSAPTVDVNSPQLHEERSRGLRPLPLVLLGAGVVAGGVGGYFGLQSRGNIQDARETFRMEARSSHLEEARSQALVANILFGAAITAAAGAAFTWFTSHETGRVAEVSP